MLFCFVLNLYSFIHSIPSTRKAPFPVKILLRPVSSLLRKLSVRILSNFLTSKGHTITVTFTTPCFHLWDICIHG